MVDWRTVGILCCTRSGVSIHTAKSIRALVNRGARDLVLDGITDVAMARNCALTAAADLTRQHRDIALWLLVDDDMSFELQAAEQLCSAALESGHPTSGVYVSNNGRVMATVRPGEPTLTGLGFFALPSRRLLELADDSVTVLWGDNSVRVFCQSAVWHEGSIRVWRSEDYWLCMRLGDVQIAPVAAAHHRLVPLLPDGATVAQAARAEKETLP